jgi:hypothetical protein
VISAARKASGHIASAYGELGRFNVLILFALILFRGHDTIVNRVCMEHYRNEIEEKQTEAPPGRCERSQERKNPNWDRASHPEKARQHVSLVNVSQSRNDTQYNCYGVARLALRGLHRAARPITSVTPFGILRQEMPAVWAGHCVASAWLGPCGWCVRVLHAHLQLLKVTRHAEFVKQTSIAFRVGV